MARLLCGLFFASGAAALVFETLWFHQASLAFGNGVWSAAVTLAAFMTGLALGNALAARIGSRLRRPLRVYAGLELLVGVSGIVVVLALPGLGAALGSRLDHLGVRFVVAFVVMLVPATAMGATLPVLIRPVVHTHKDFTASLGGLYGWNTLGAVTGLLAAELWLIEALGIRGAALAAGTVGVVVASVALLVDRPLKPETSRAARVPVRWLVAAGLAGATMLGLEVVWFRVLRLVQAGTAVVFAVMLAVALAGIGLGGLAAVLLSRRFPTVHTHVAAVAWLAGAATVFGYASLWPTYAGVHGAESHDMLRLAVYGGALMLPTAVLSGVLFTWIGTAVQAELRTSAMTAGLLTLANTTGAGLGALLAGFVLLPVVGMENALALLAIVYGSVAILLPHAKRSRVAGPAIWVLAVVLFPRGRLEATFFKHVLAPYRSQIVAIREGPIQTAFLLEELRFGRSYAHRLVTDNSSMASTEPQALRYMKLFVWIPVALQPDPERALLVSYGLGSTASALVATRSLQQIDVVETSQDILELSPLVHGEDDPLLDPRVQVHVEDARFFLQTHEGSYDLITAEPPPPKQAGVVNLYTQEHFALLHDRLAPGGIASYWLPAHALTDQDTRAIMAAFCGVFEDCTLWSGAGLDWILIGTRDAAPSAGFAAQWDDPDVAAELAERGIEEPAQLAALFLAGTRDLKRWTRKEEPLTDNYPRRLSTDAIWVHTFSRFYREILDAEIARRRFEDSDYAARNIPDDLRVAALERFKLRSVVTGVFLPLYRETDRWHDLEATLATDLRVPVLLLFGSDPVEQAILEHTEEATSETAFLRALGLLADRDPAAEAALRASADAGHTVARALGIFLACLDADRETLRADLAGYVSGRPDPALIDFVDERCPLD